MTILGQPICGRWLLPIICRNSQHGQNARKRQPMTAYETMIVERPEPRIARIVMNRPEARNAQNLQMTYDLNAAFDNAAQDDAVKVIILAGSGPHFSAGHDLRPGAKNQAGVDFSPVGNWGGFAPPTAHCPFSPPPPPSLPIPPPSPTMPHPT